MSIHFGIDRDIAIEILRTLPIIAMRDGQIVVRSSRGMLVITSSGSRGSITYSYTPTNQSDISINQTGLIADETDHIAELAYYLLETDGGKISRTPEDTLNNNSNNMKNINGNSRKSGNFTGLNSNTNRGKQIYNTNIVTSKSSNSRNINSRINVNKNVNAGGGTIGAEGLADMGGGRGTRTTGKDMINPVISSPVKNSSISRSSFTNAVPNGYGSYDTTGIQTTFINESNMPNQGRGYSLSGGSTGDLLTSNTYDGGNSILTGGSDAYRSNYGSNRLPGTEYGEYLDKSYNGYEDTLNGSIQDVTDTTDTYLYGGNDDDVDYIGGGNASMNASPFLDNGNRTGFIDNNADINARMYRMNNPGINQPMKGAGVNMTRNSTTVGSVNVMRGLPMGYNSSVDRRSSTLSNGYTSIINGGSGILGIGTDFTGNGPDVLDYGGVPDTYNDAASDLGIGYGDMTARGMGSTTTGSYGGNNISRNAYGGGSNAQRGLGMGLGGDG